MTEQQKHELTQELLTLESQKSAIQPVALVRACKAFLEKMQSVSRWDDSRSAIGAKFWNLVEDTQNYNSYLSYVDITARTRALLAWAAQKLSQAEAQAEGVAGLRNMSAQAVETHLETTQRLSKPGGALLEVARETPEPLVDEAVRRGEQVKDVAAEVYEETKPIGRKLVDELDDRGITNPLLAISCLSMLVFMKNKALSVIMCLGLIYLLKGHHLPFNMPAKPSI